MGETSIREVTSFCRLCIAGCGTRLWIDRDDRIVQVRPDADNPTSRGYGCSKGMQAEEAHHGPGRILHPLKRQPDGTFVEIGLEQALDEIAEKIRPIYDAGDRDAIALLKGNAGTMVAAATAMAESFIPALGSRSYYTATTIDQPNKMVSFERLGGWRAGLQGIEGSDVALLFGTNPLVSHSCGGFLFSDPARRLKQARAAGLTLIVVDPRASETARQADIHIQSISGQDPAIAGGLIRIILDEGWHDADFTGRFVGPGGLASLRAAVDPLTEAFVERRAGLPSGQLRRVAEIFARNGRRGAAYTATGPSMAPFGSLAQHLINGLNVVCGRYRRAGDKVPVDPTRPAAPVFEEATSPPRNFERVAPSRIRGAGMLGRERLTATLPEEILTPGEGQVRCLIVLGSNPMASIPDTRKVRDALRALDMLVVIAPHMSATAEQAHYILPPTMQYERADLQLSIPGVPVYSDNWAQYTSALISPPAGSELCEDWYPLWALAKRLGVAIDFCGTGPLPVDVAPTTNDLLALRMEGARVSFDELRTYPSGKIWDFEDGVVLPGRPRQSGSFDLMPGDVADELDRYLGYLAASQESQSPNPDFPYLLSCRRTRHAHCTVGVEMEAVRARFPFNPLYLHPLDMEAIAAEDGDTIRVTSDHADILAIVEADRTMRPGCVAMSFGWGSDPADATQGWDGTANINLLIACDRNTDAVTALPRMSAIPVRLAVVEGVTPSRGPGRRACRN